MNDYDYMSLRRGAARLRFALIRKVVGNAKSKGGVFRSADGLFSLPESYRGALFQSFEDFGRIPALGNALHGEEWATLMMVAAALRPVLESANNASFSEGFKSDRGPAFAAKVGEAVRGKWLASVTGLTFPALRFCSPLRERCASELKRAVVAQLRKESREQIAKLDGDAVVRLLVLLQKREDARQEDARRAVNGKTDKSSASQALASTSIEEVTKRGAGTVDQKTVRTILAEQLDWPSGAERGLLWDKESGKLEMMRLDYLLLEWKRKGVDLEAEVESLLAEVKNAAIERKKILKPA